MLFSVKNPPDLATLAAVKSVNANFYDGVWRGNRYLFINAGATSPNYDFASTVYAIDTSLADPTSAFIPILPEIPGASGGLTFDRFGTS